MELLKNGSNTHHTVLKAFPLPGSNCVNEYSKSAISQLNNDDLNMKNVSKTTKKKKKKWRKKHVGANIRELEMFGGQSTHWLLKTQVQFPGPKTHMAAHKICNYSPRGFDDPF